MDIQKRAVLYASIMLFMLCGCKETPSGENYTLDNQNREHWKAHSNISEHVFDAGNVGFWGQTPLKLPVFNYTAPLPLITRMRDSTEVGYPEDPWFLIGNYRFNCFVHASGGYQILSMERAIARLNDAGSPHDHNTYASVAINGKKHSLVGMGSALAVDGNTEKVFGCGFAQFNYQPEKDISVSRTLATLPSDKVNQGHPAMLLKVTIENNSSEKIKFIYNEGVTARYHMAVWNNPPFRKKRIRYTAEPMEFYPESKTIGARFIPREETPLVTLPRDEMALADGFPPSLIMRVIDNEHIQAKIGCEQVDSAALNLNGEAAGVIASGKKQTFYYMIGYSRDNGLNDWHQASYALQEAIAEKEEAIPFHSSWRKKIPAFPEEENDSFRTEMQWHAYVLDAMANYNEFYDETYIPQGNVYEYGVGVSAALSDHMMHSLPVAHYNPALAKSIMRFTLKHANFRGALYASDEGCGRIPLGPASKSNSYTYFLMTITEYLRATNDIDFLHEEVPFWGMPHTKKGTVLDRIERIFLFFRDEVSVGQHGLPRLLNSDWNDCFYFFFNNMSYHHIFGNAESHMNAAMAAKYLKELPDILEQMKETGKLNDLENKTNILISAMRDYQHEILNGLIDDMGDREFLSRAYIGKDVHVGEKNLFLEPQIFALGITDLSMNKRKKIWKSVKTRVWEMEKKGARQNEIPLGSDYEDVSKGSRENGGFWFSLNGPLIVNLIDVDRSAAEDALYKITLMNHARQFPNYWVGMWSGGDSFDSSLLPTEGLTNKYLFPFPVYCAHSHAWPLWGYLMLYDYL